MTVNDVRNTRFDRQRQERTIVDNHRTLKHSSLGRIFGLVVANSSMPVPRVKFALTNAAISLFRTALLLLVFSTPAYAYVDGGSALFLLQGLFAAIGAALALIKKPRQLIAKLFGRRKDSDA